MLYQDNCKACLARYNAPVERKVETCIRCQKEIKGTAYMLEIDNKWRPHHYSCASRAAEKLTRNS